MKTIRLKPGKERSLQRRHPWVFDGAIAKGGADAGETVRVDSAEGEFLAWGAYSPDSKIRVRAWSFDPAQRIDAAFFRDALARALALRERLALASDGVRLVHGESDGLPGLVGDRYGDTLVAQFGAAGVERWKDTIADALPAITAEPDLDGLIARIDEETACVVVQYPDILGRISDLGAVAEAAHAKGMKVIVLTGKDGGKMAGLADVEIRVPHFGYADRIQEVHIKVIHILIQLVEKEMVK